MHAWVRAGLHGISNEKGCGKEGKERKGGPVITRCIIIVTKQGCEYEINEYVF
jgi:hypothetical protein